MTGKKLWDQLKAFRLHIDRNIISYGICVLIASVLWFLNALNKDYTTDIAYPVKYTDFPHGKYLVSKLPSHITLEVKAKGFALFAHRIRTSFLPVIFNVNTYSNHLLEKDNVYEYTLHLNDIRDRISNQLNSDIKLLNIQPEEIEFRFSKAVTRRIAVRPVVQYTLKQQYILKNGIVCSPDSVTASGPAAIIDTLNSVSTHVWDAGEIKKDITRILPLNPVPGIKVEENEVKISMQPERYTEANRSIPIKIQHLPDSLDIKLFPETVEITYEVGLSRYDAVKDADFLFTVDYKKAGHASFLPVHAARYPAFIKDLKYTPQKVEFILEKK